MGRCCELVSGYLATVAAEGAMAGFEDGDCLKIGIMIPLNIRNYWTDFLSSLCLLLYNTIKHLMTVLDNKCICPLKNNLFI